VAHPCPVPSPAKSWAHFKGPRRLAKSSQTIPALTARRNRVEPPREGLTYKLIADQLGISIDTIVGDIRFAPNGEWAESR